MQYYIRKFLHEFQMATGDIEPAHFGILAAIVVIMGYFLLRGMHIGR